MKSTLSELALLGGTPAFTHKLHVGQPNLGDRAYFMERAGQILDSRWFTNNGECVQELERELGVRWRSHRTWYGRQWAMRPIKAKLKKKRPPSRFVVLVATRA